MNLFHLSFFITILVSWQATLEILNYYSTYINISSDKYHIFVICLYLDLLFLYLFLPLNLKKVFKVIIGTKTGILHLF